MNGTVTMPVWVLVVLVAGLLGFGLLGAWVNAWIAVRFVRRGGRFTAPAAERLLSRQERRLLEELARLEASGDEAAGPEDEGRVLP